MHRVHHHAGVPLVGATADSSWPQIMRACRQWASSVPGGVGLAALGEDALMTRRVPRSLRGIERELAGSDPGLDALFRSFARRRGGCDMFWVERIGRKKFLLFGPRHQRTLTERVKLWCAENWTDP